MKMLSLTALAAMCLVSLNVGAVDAHRYAKPQGQSSTGMPLGGSYSLATAFPEAGKG